MNFREKSADFVSGLDYQEQEREPYPPIFNRVMGFNFLLSVRIVLSEVVRVVHEKILGGHHTSVFFLRDLWRLYQDQLKYLSSDEDMIKTLM